MMRVILLILAIISGLFTAYMLGRMDDLDEENQKEFEDTLVILGKFSLQDQKALVLNFLKFGVLINVPYIVLAVFYFYGQTVPFVLALSMMVMLFVEYRVQLSRVRKADEIEEAVAINTTFGKLSEFWSLVVYAIHIAYLI